MLSNPFCFVLQVLAVLQEIRLSQRGCLPGIKQAELLRRYGPEPSPLADYGISSIKSPHTARWPLRPSSVTSHHVSILEATKGREPASHPSGPGSSTTGGMLSNPFCFVLQVLAVLQEIRLSQRGCLPGIKQAELLRRYGPEPSPLADYGISSIKSPHTARWPLRPSSVTSHHVSILEATKGREPASHPSGPGSSTTGGMLSNPFCFVLQLLGFFHGFFCDGAASSSMVPFLRHVEPADRVPPDCPVTGLGDGHSVFCGFSNGLPRAELLIEAIVLQPVTGTISL
ncbi:hypothetical protein MRX96_028957 [Rhipicephalus microplus]